MRLDLFILGYFDIYIRAENIAAAMTALLRAGLSARFRDGKISVASYRVKKYKKALSGIPHNVSSLRGIPGVIYANRKRCGIYAGLFFVFVCWILFSFFVWDVRVEGNETLPSSVVEAELENAGLFAGSSWHSLSLSEVERHLLASSEDIGWVNINRKGSVAFVTVREKNTVQNPEEPSGYSNIVAACDCVIEEITVKSGIPMVKAGDTVKEGQLLISGVIPDELGGGFLRAEGVVIGRVSENFGVEVPRCEEVLMYGEETLYESKIKIFNFSINIFKNYRNSDEDCAIIESIEECMILGKYRLPVKIMETYTKKAQIQKFERSDSELVSVAASRLSKLRIIKLCDAEILKIKTDGEFTSSGYLMTSSVIVLRDIGEERYLES